MTWNLRTLFRIAPVFVLAAFLAAPALALDPNRKTDEYMVDFWQEDSGLPQKYVSVIHQTRDGYLWIGTRGGVARFDGVRFTTYDDRYANQLRENEVRALAEDRDGGLWIATFGGGVSRLSKGQFTTYRTQEGLPSDFVRTVTAAPDGDVWIGTERGLARWHEGRFTTYTVKDGLPSDRIWALHTDAGGIVWIGTHAGLSSVGPDGRLVNHTARHPEDLDDTVGVMADDGQGGLWLATGHHGLLQYKDRVVARVTKKDGLDTDHVIGVCVDPQGTVWMATLGQLFRYRNGRVERLAAQVAQVSGNRTMQVSSLDRIQTVFADREGSVWVGTALDGMARVRDAIFGAVSAGEDGGRERRLTSIFADSRGRVWMGVANGGRVARAEGGAVTVMKLPIAQAVDSILEDRNGAIWIENEEQLLKLESDRLVPVAGIPAEMSATLSVIAGIAMKDGTLWLGDRANGLVRHRDGRFTAFGQEQGLAGRQVRALAEDSRGGLWVGTRDGGVAGLRDGAVVASYGVEQGLPSVSVSALYVDKDDGLWVSTRSGLVRIRDGKVHTFGAPEGLPANHFYQIVEDDLGYLWMTYARGVARVSRQGMNDVADGKARTVDVRTFGTESGLRSTAMVVPNQPSVSKGPDGRLWFATGGGAFVVNPAAIVANHVPPPVWVEKVRVDGDDYTPAEGLSFPPGHGEVEVSYVGLSFVAPERVRFKYMLEGFDDGWVEAGTRRAAYYTNLPPGSYRFRVRACNNDGVWNETGHTLGFHLRPHWYQRRSVHALAVLLLGVALAAAYRWRVRQHELHAVELAQKVEAAVSQLKLLRGMLPICAGCKKIRDDTGYWNQMETYISDHSDADFSHGMCPDCLERLYPEYAALQQQAKP